ncbi:MAG: methyltransferase domain-containing protein [Candidatus Marinimicrobia bacterium]|nr:methyltransferase domain-containing protein [Candidatus Neomarinimicrobiota bacterium]MBL7011258.1 methyltransferase domain-containing protein [Candidatus Neomarinimicrobiota bacterium]
MKNLPENNSQLWEDKYLADSLGWDLGGPTPIFSQMASDLNPGKICIVGCGRGHDAIFFAQNGFDVTAVDFAPSAIVALKSLAKSAQVKINTVEDDIFSLPLKYENTFDYMIEQTCFCAIDPTRRKDYENMAKSILKPGGQLIGLWFPLDKTMEEGGPPYATSIVEVKSIFDLGWKIVKEEFPDLSIKPRKGREKLIIFQKV